MKLTNNFNENVSIIKNILNIGRSFDVIERVLMVGGRTFKMYYIDGFVKDDIMHYIMSGFLNIRKEQFDAITSPQDFIQNFITYVEVGEDNDVDSIVTQVLSGQTAILIEGFSNAVMIDSRTYPARGPEEPEKEKVLRGSRDGFVETIVFNTAMIRRRIRDPRLAFEIISIGKMSKTDVAVGYVDGMADKKTLNLVKEKLNSLNIEALTMADQSLVESVIYKNWYNPLPKVRYTERPDVAAAHLMEGKIILIVDNSPSAIILPTGFFDFLQDVDDYYLPVITGNFIRIIRNTILFSTLILSPLYILILKEPNNIISGLKFLLPTDEFAIPIILQFLLLEIAIDGLNLASLNTPGSLGMALSVVGALILGEFAVKTGWFIPQTILYMAVIALGGFSQPSIELSYSIKFARMILLVLTSWLSLWGFIGGLIFFIIMLATTKTFTGEPYLYPLIPFNGKKLVNLIFRTRLVNKQ